VEVIEILLWAVGIWLALCVVAGPLAFLWEWCKACRKVE
jgi:hypothetical protein